MITTGLSSFAGPGRRAPGAPLPAAGLLHWDQAMRAARVKELAFECGFELCGVTPAEPVAEAGFYQSWVAAGYAAGMRYLTDRRAPVRNDPRNLLPSARSIVCVGKLYNTPHPASPVSRYAWGGDYHDVLRDGLNRLATALQAEAPAAFEYKICVDTAPLLERAYARRAGLGWIGRNSCIINQSSGSWFFLGELLVSLELEPDAPPPDRCGTCTRCIDACPTQAIVPAPGPGYTVDSRRCISYHTIESREPVPEPLRRLFSGLIFGCDICQDVCPWNSRAPVSPEPAFAPRPAAPLADLAAMSESAYRDAFRSTPLLRTRYSGFLRNLALAMGNKPRSEYRPVLERLACSPDPLVAEQACWSLRALDNTSE